ncbi:uncharacterized protein CTRU02_202135 [Colletotrichum truncatum]|uniref:Uncharacterized protein n=1 Tax=Colletotrichum truncatum TaxID=5467 RepID=A0ACC3ZK11_COLTU|nr:uncharacterized protein CTRU02_01298 [Colletotrichum truncatum]KAF6799619.1 hypothetical protein CTRU02_01298 [Colletotrichum truncatum]
MWQKLTLLLSLTLLLLASVSFVDGASGIATKLQNKRGNEPDQAPTFKVKNPKISLGPHLAPATFPHDNPFNLTEQDALNLDIKIIPVDNDHWDALVRSTGLDESTTGKNGNRLKQAHQREFNPPDPTDWCTPNKNTSQCMFGAWCHSQSNINVPNRAWVFYNDCELTGDLHPWQWSAWMDIYSGLPWVTIFYINPTRWPILKYAGRKWDGWSKGWEIYYPYRTNGIYYYRRYFDCS